MFLGLSIAVAEHHTTSLLLLRAASVSIMRTDAYQEASAEHGSLSL